MRILLIGILFILFSCGSEEEQYKMLHFGKENKDPLSEDAILFKMIKGNQEEFGLIFPNEDHELKALLYQLGKGDLVEILNSDHKSIGKGDQLQVIAFRKGEEVEKMVKGLQPINDLENARIAEYLFEQKETYVYETGVFLFRKQLSGSGVKGVKNSIYRVEMECELLNGKNVYSTQHTATLFEFNKSMPGQVTEGLGMVMDLMEEGDEFWAVIPSKYSFGAKGVDNLVPPNEPLMYKLKLIEIII